METQRLILRRFTPEDFSDFSELIRDKMASAYAAFDEQFPTGDEGLRSVLKYFSGSDDFFAVELKAERKVVGFTAFNTVDEITRNLGYYVHTAYQSRGYATEAVEKIIEYAKNDLRLRKLVSGTAEINVPSVRLLKRAGFTITGKGTASFDKDSTGAPVEFVGISFERVL